MSIFDTNRMGWIWGNVSIDNEPIYFEAIWRDQPAHSDELDPVPGSIILALESSNWMPSGVTDSDGTYISFPLSMAPGTGYPGMASMFATSPGPGYLYNGWGPGTYKFYCGVIDWSGNPGPLMESFGDPMQITTGEGEVRGNVYIRPYAHGEEWGFTKDAKGIMIYAQKDDLDIYPIGMIDFLLGWRKVGDYDCIQPANEANIENGVYWAAPIPFRYCAGNSDDEEVPGLLSLTGDIGLGSAGTISWDWEDYEGPVDDNGDMLYTFRQGEGANVDTMSISPADFKNMMISRGFNNRMAHRDSKPFKYFSWPPNSSFEEVTGTRVEDVGKQWRWTCATQSNGYAYIGNVAHCQPDNLLVADEEDISGESGGMIRNTLEDRVLRSGYRQWNKFDPRDFLSIVINDGDEIVALESYSDKVLVFRKRSISVLNTAEAFEKVEDTFDQGIEQECAKCLTPHGIAFVSNDTVFLYNGKTFQNLSSKSFTFKRVFEQYSSDDEYDAYNNFVHKRENLISKCFAQSIGYAPKGDKLIILMNVQASNVDWGAAAKELGFGEEHDVSTGVAGAAQLKYAGLVKSETSNTSMDILTRDALMYNFKSKNWTFLKDRVPGNGPKSNFITMGSDLVYYNPENGLLYKWDDDAGFDANISNATNASIGEGQSEVVIGGGNIGIPFTYITPYFDFGRKNIKKKLKRVYVTVRSSSYTTGLAIAYVRDNSIDWSTVEKHSNGSVLTSSLINSDLNHFSNKSKNYKVGATSYLTAQVWFGAIGSDIEAYPDGYQVITNEDGSTTYTGVVELVPEENNKDFYNISFVVFSNSQNFISSGANKALEILDISVTYREKAIR